MQSVSCKVSLMKLQHHRCRVAVGPASQGGISQTLDYSQIYACTFGSTPVLSSVYSYSLQNPTGDMSMIYANVCS